MTPADPRTNQLLKTTNISSSPTARAREIIALAIKDHDDGGYAFAGVNEILATRIAVALEQERREAMEACAKVAHCSEECKRCCAGCAEQAVRALAQRGDTDAR